MYVTKPVGLITGEFTIELLDVMAYHPPSIPLWYGTILCPHSRFGIYEKGESN